MGRVATRLVRFAEEEAADLLVIGSHERGLLGRLWEGSVSRGVIESAKCAVLCVPAAAHDERPVTAFRSVLAATDFSPLGDEAVRLAYAAVAPGGTVHVVHVARGAHDTVTPRDVLNPEQSGVDPITHAELRFRLDGRVSPDTRVRSETHVLESDSAAKAIVQAAERLGVDLICVGTPRPGRRTHRIAGLHGHRSAPPRHPPRPPGPPGLTPQAALNPADARKAGDGQGSVQNRHVERGHHNQRVQEPVR
jgi:nucleotide-binding universal stress UspA family protein